MEQIDLTAIHVGDRNVQGYAFVIPLDAPLPGELAGVTLPSGTLYKRLAALDTESADTDFALIPVAGTELVALDRAWRHLQHVKKVAVLSGLPGARYDTLFTMASRQIGLPSVDWDSVAVSLAERVRLKQRTADKTPWSLKKDLAGSHETDEPAGFAGRPTALTAPATPEEDVDADLT